MKKNYLKNEAKSLRKVGLSADEKEKMLGNLMGYADENMGMLEIMEDLWESDSPFEETFTSWFDIIQQKWGLVASTALIALVLWGGTSLAAEGSLPGDLLYGMKVNVSEPLRGAVAGSAIEAAHWEAVKADRRLKEAEILASQGKLDEKTQSDIQARFEKNSAAFNTYVAKAEQEGQGQNVVALRSDFEQSVALRTDALKSLRDEMIAVAPTSAAITSVSVENNPVAGKVMMRFTSPAPVNATMGAGAKVNDDSLFGKANLLDRLIDTAEKELHINRGEDGAAPSVLNTPLLNVISTTSVQAAKDGGVAIPVSSKAGIINILEDKPVIDAHSASTTSSARNPLPFSAEITSKPDINQSSVINALNAAVNAAVHASVSSPAPTAVQNAPVSVPPLALPPALPAPAASLGL